MEPGIEEQRQAAHELLDCLPAEKLSVVRNLLEVLAEPINCTAEEAALEAEELSPDTEAAIVGARASLARGESVTHEELLREFGLRQ